MGKKSIIVAEIIDDIRRVFQVVNEQSKKAKRETGLTGPQLWAIKMVGELSPIRVSDLAARMYLHPATVVGILNRLELRGLIKRIRTNEDRRVVKIVLTDTGNAIVVKAPQVAQGLLVAGLEVLPLKKLEDISDALEELVLILGAQELPPRLILSQEINLNKRKSNKSSPPLAASRTTEPSD
jgi:MarR family transcriptional regulator, organic hydroperoxide resistance regulator